MFRNHLKSLVCDLEKHVSSRFVAFTRYPQDPVGKSDRTGDMSKMVCPLSVWRHACVSVLHNLMVPLYKPTRQNPVGEDDCRPSQRGAAERFGRRYYQAMEHGYTSVPPYAHRSYSMGTIACRPPQRRSGECFGRRHHQAMEIDHSLPPFIIC